MGQGSRPSKKYGETHLCGTSLPNSEGGMGSLLYKSFKKKKKKQSVLKILGHKTYYPDFCSWRSGYLSGMWPNRWSWQNEDFVRASEPQLVSLVKYCSGMSLSIRPDLCNSEAEGRAHIPQKGGETQGRRTEYQEQSVPSMDFLSSASKDAVTDSLWERCWQQAKKKKTRAKVEATTRKQHSRLLSSRTPMSYWKNLGSFPAIPIYHHRSENQWADWNGMLRLSQTQAAKYSDQRRDIALFD